MFSVFFLRSSATFIAQVFSSLAHLAMRHRAHSAAFAKERAFLAICETHVQRLFSRKSYAAAALP
jgi:hypothetical protein